MTENAARIGWGREDITPPGEVSLLGQFYERITAERRDPLFATCLALEAGDGSDQVVLVSCDLAQVPSTIVDRVRAVLGTSVPGLDPGHVIVGATHTHTAPVLPMSDGDRFGMIAKILGADTDPLDYRALMEAFRRDPEGGMTPDEYGNFVASRIASAVSSAWQERRAGSIGTTSTYAALSHNRRILYDDGTAVMYGPVRTPHFRGMAGPEDHRMEVLCTWTADGELTGVLVNVACTAQFLESTRKVSADLFGDVRRAVAERWNDRVHVLGFISAAGDLAPRDLIRGWDRNDPEQELRRGAAELMRALVPAVAEAEEDRETAPTVAHCSRTIALPLRRVTKSEVECASGEWEAIRVELQESPDPVAHLQALGPVRVQPVYDSWAIVNRARQLATYPFFDVELHVCRIGDSVLVTNPFELFLEYGQRIKSRSVASRTVLLQLTCGIGGYLPTDEAIKSGGYSTRVFSGVAGQEGGDFLVEQSLAAISELWEGGGP